jgi:hypothetical protein
MAIQLTKTIDSGASGEYWRIVKITVDIESNYSEVNVGLYIDQAARDAGKNPLMRENYSFSGADNPCTLAAMESASVVQLAYDKLKSLTNFFGSIDV